MYINLWDVIIMTLKNTKSSRDIRNVAATMAIEGMYLSDAFIEELVKVSKGEKTSEQLRQEVIRKYTVNTDKTEHTARSRSAFVPVNRA